MISGFMIGWGWVDLLFRLFLRPFKAVLKKEPSVKEGYVGLGNNEYWEISVKRELQPALA